MFVKRMKAMKHKQERLTDSRHLNEIFFDTF
jgi:hypothetical protein